MTRIAISFVVVAAALAFSQSAQAQQPWIVHQPTIVHKPVVVHQPVVVHPGVVTHVRPPVAVYKPTTIRYTRNRPILGGSVNRYRRGYRRVWL